MVGLFESAGIPAVLLDRNLTAYEIAMAHATNGYRIALPKSRVVDADEVLLENGYVIPDIADPSDNDVICPNCLYSVRAGNSCQNCRASGHWEECKGRKVWVVKRQEDE